MRQEHTQLLDAYIAGDAALAQSLLTEHISHARNALLAALRARPEFAET